MTVESVISKYTPTLISARLQKKEILSFFRNPSLIFSQSFAHEKTLYYITFQLFRNNLLLFFPHYSNDEIILMYEILYVKFLKLWLKTQ